ncbi:MAG: ankyrin repeat domain-containing protein [Fluviicola sp.]
MITEEQFKLVIRGCDLNKARDILNSENVNNQLNGKSILQHAMECDCIEIIYFIIDLGVNVNQTFSEGSTPLIVACEKNNYDLVEYLLKKEADPNTTNKNHMTAIWYTALDENETLVKLLMSYGANPFVDSGNGMSTYDAAKQMDLDEIVELIDSLKE